jgi:hypothetical protein
VIREHENEPAPGLPERLPAGEKVLWQGAPRWRPLARRAFHVRAIALYFLALAAWGAASAAAEGATAGTLALDALWLALVASVPIGTLLVVSVLAARTTLYTVTDRRVVMRVGVALPTAVNVPLAAVQSAGLRRCRDGTGDIALALVPSHRVSFVVAARAPLALLEAGTVAARAAGRGGGGPRAGDGPGRDRGGGAGAGRAGPRAAAR